MIINPLTIDVEEYFHPAEVQHATSIEEWPSLPSRVEAQTERVLELLDRHSVTATFYILGWVAERHPQVVRKIAQAGHQIGCHSYAHHLVYSLTPAQFRQDTLRAVEAIENAGGITPRIYRAPSYSITLESLWALEILVECGFLCDSSIVPINHDRYGIPGFKRHSQILQTPSGPIAEIPVATAQLTKKTIIPVGGGAYLRLLPYRYMAAGIRRINLHEHQPACIFFHPWELDAAQPRLAKKRVSRMRTYLGLSRMEGKLDRLMTEFQFSSLASVYPKECLSQIECAAS